MDGIQDSPDCIDHRKRVLAWGSIRPFGMTIPPFDHGPGRGTAEVINPVLEGKDVTPPEVIETVKPNEDMFYENTIPAETSSRPPWCLGPSHSSMSGPWPLLYTQDLKSNLSNLSNHVVGIVRNYTRQGRSAKILEKCAGMLTLQLLS
jgi:hypothetical protein